MAPGLVPARLGVLGILVAFLPWPSLEVAPRPRLRAADPRGAPAAPAGGPTQRIGWRLSVEAHVTVSALPTEKRSLLEQFARRLLEKEVVERDELQALLAGAKLS